jgi:glycosyltransferase involved in cell wall biosynthesis
MARPAKVLHVLNSAGGGAALSTIGLVEALRESGIESCAVCHDAGSADERERLREAVRGEVLFTPLYWWNRKIRTALWKRPLLELRQGLRTGWARRSASDVHHFAAKRGVDLIHTNTILTPEGGFAAVRAGLPHVWHIRELVGDHYPFPLGLSGRRLGAFLERHATRLVANSEATARLIRPLLRRELLDVVPNGIDLRRFRPRTEPSGRQRVIVAMVGSLTSRWKNHRLFVDAAARVPESLPVEFRIYGHDPGSNGNGRPDPYASGLRQAIVEGGLEARFSFPGFVSDPARIMSDIDILAHPAEHESFGRIAVEAMAAGLPVVGVRDGGIAEVVEHEVTGLLAPPNDADEMAASIARLASNPDQRARMGLAGRKRAEALYSLDAHATRMVQVYEAAMYRPRQG